MFKENALTAYSNDIVQFPATLMIHNRSYMSEPAKK